MPELPEVETIRRVLALRISGRRIVRAEFGARICAARFRRCWRGG